MQIRVVTAVAVFGALAAGAVAPPAFSRGGTQGKGQPAATAAQGLNARLRVSARSPLQLHGVLLDASSSRGDIAKYVFHYGDGIVERSYSPLALHGYRNPGTYRATVTVVDPDGQQVTSSAVTIRVRDGIAPGVRIDSPRPDQRLHLGTAGALFRGVASDSHGVSKVELAIQLVSPTRQFKTHGKCIWYDPRRVLVLSDCSTPFFFAAKYAHGRWSFRMAPAAALPAGHYVVRALAIDRAGNISHFYSVGLRTILPFRLAP
ncbi:MAG: PKD domain-containing protein [Actinomycetota bacterium]|nr:PKD domain-containing protein [Actinomycetota bacterium]